MAERGDYVRDGGRASSVVAVALVGIVCVSTGAALLRVLQRVVRTPNVLLGPLPR